MESSEPDGVLVYEKPGGGWLPSDMYTWPDLIKAVRMMATDGVGGLKFWLGDNAEDVRYGLVNVAAFLAQCMQETIKYNACDENNWSGPGYPASSACGQAGQSYQDYTCSPHLDQLAGGKMACEVDPDMEIRATNQAGWWGAPARLFCAPRSKVPKAPRWDTTSPECWGVKPFDDDVPLDEYFEYVNNGGSCKDHKGIKVGGWKLSGNLANPKGRTDVEGCCWWGRGAIQTTGVCNFGKLNYYLGKRAFDEGRASLYPDIDFCKNPGAICEDSSHSELKWVTGIYFWLETVQTYSSGGWRYKDNLRKWVDNGMNMNDYSFIDAASGIVNRGCHNPPCASGGLLHGPERRENFKKVLKAMGLA
jgi:hypothetical protein